MRQALFAALLIAAAGCRSSYMAEQIPSLLKQHKVEGASIALIDHGRVVSTTGFGLASVKQQIPVTARTLFNVGSISKPLTAVAVLQLADEGTLDLDAPVERYLGGWRFRQSPFDPQGVTLRRILSHTAGLSIAGVWAFQPNEPLSSLRETLSRDTPYAEEVDELWDGKGGVRIILQPSSKWRYSGGGYALAQLAIENVAHQHFAAYMHDRVLRPLHMKNSTFGQTPSPLLAQPYGAKGEEVPVLKFNAQSAAALVSNAEDLGQFVANVVIRRTDMHEPQPGSAPNPWGNDGWGLGFPLERLADGRRLAFHFGGNEGFTAMIAGIPEVQSGIAVLTNSSNGLGFCFSVLCRWLSTQSTGRPDICKDVQ